MIQQFRDVHKHKIVKCLTREQHREAMRRPYAFGALLKICLPALNDIDGQTFIASIKQCSVLSILMQTV